jgi:hypothetical protein
MNLNSPKYDSLELKEFHQAHLKAIQEAEEQRALNAGKFMIFSVVR